MLGERLPWGRCGGTGFDAFCAQRCALLTHFAAEEAEAGKVVEKVAEADLEPGAGLADGGDEAGLESVTLIAEDVFEAVQGGDLLGNFCAAFRLGEKSANRVSMLRLRHGLSLAGMGIISTAGWGF